jgi:hypothetical protein
MSFSRDPNVVLQDALQKGYSRVRFQQGKPVLDRELNLAADLASAERIAQGYIGDGVADTGFGFLIIGLNVGANDFTIKAGRALVGGREVVLAADTTYKNQPNKSNVAPLPAGISSVSLRAFTRTVTEAQDATLGNAGASDVGSVTSIREMVDWEVVVTPGNNVPAGNFRLSTIDAGASTVTDRRRTGLNTAALRDEIADARGPLTRLADRLSTSLDTNGALKPNTVGGAQIADNAVSTNKLADLNVTTNKIADLNVTNTKLSVLAVEESKIANQAISKRTIRDNAVSIAGLSKTLVADAQFSLPASPGAGQLGLLVVNLFAGEADAFFLISVRQVAPRAGGILPQSLGFTWTRQVAVFKPFGIGARFTHTHQLLVQNPTSTVMTVACKAYRIDET